MEIKVISAEKKDEMLHLIELPWIHPGAHDL